MNIFILVLHGECWWSCKISENTVLARINWRISILTLPVPQSETDFFFFLTKSEYVRNVMIGAVIPDLIFNLLL